MSEPPPAPSQLGQSPPAWPELVVDGLGTHICVLDETGCIVAVNRAWREFARANGGQPDAVHEGANYRQVCLAAARASTAGPAAAEADAEALRFSQLLDDVLQGRRQQFELEYPCHSPTEQRWFVVRVRRLEGEGPTRIVVAHDNITALRRAEEAARRDQALLADVAASLPGATFRARQWPNGTWEFEYLSPGVGPLFEVQARVAHGDWRVLWSRVAWRDRAALAASVAVAATGGQHWEQEFRVATPTVRERWIHAKAAPRLCSEGLVLWTGFFHDMTERKRVEAALRASEETFRNLFETVPQGVVYQDRDGRITAANPAAQRILGLTLDQLQGRSSIDPRWHAMREDGSPFPGHEHPAMVTLRTGKPVNNVVMGVGRPDDSQVWILVNATPVFKHGEVDEVFTSFEDITQRVQLSAELRRQAATDELTGLPNRRRFAARLNDEFVRLARRPEASCGLLAVDIDHFKTVNDRFGHAAGDAVLVRIASVMRQAVREQDLVARWGGEEFMLLLPDTGQAEAAALAERLRERVQAERIHHAGRAICVTASVGLDTMSSRDPNAEAALLRADRALYRAKNRGRNRVEQG